MATFRQPYAGAPVGMESVEQLTGTAAMTTLRCVCVCPPTMSPAELTCSENLLAMAAQNYNDSSVFHQRQSLLEESV